MSGFCRVWSRLGTLRTSFPIWSIQNIFTDTGLLSLYTCIDVCIKVCSAIYADTVSVVIPYLQCMLTQRFGHFRYIEGVYFYMNFCWTVWTSFPSWVTISCSIPKKMFSNCCCIQHLYSAVYDAFTMQPFTRGSLCAPMGSLHRRPESSKCAGINFIRLNI